ncbi:MAG: alpha/beta fold hydrolase [Gammaproteobacteria bacterium]|nr:alpha/beta fold hydrolase [Gammaproteobacteria bacterium]
MTLSVFPEGVSSAVLDINGQKIECRLFGVERRKMQGVAVVCHPHPLFGGTMDNKVAHTLARAFESEGVSVLRFNFRGVGLSEGKHADGVGELADLAGLIAWLEAQFPGVPVYLAGFSFGAFVAAFYAADESLSSVNLARLFLVAPPVHHFDMSKINKFCCPVTVIMGLEDEIVPAEKVFEWSDRLTGDVPARVHKVPAATHFFHGKLTVLKQLVIDDIAAAIHG